MSLMATNSFGESECDQCCKGHIAIIWHEMLAINKAWNAKVLALPFSLPYLF